MKYVPYLICLIMLLSSQANAQSRDPMATYFNSINQQSHELEQQRMRERELIRERDEFERQARINEQRYNGLSPYEKLQDCAATSSCRGVFAR